MIKLIYNSYNTIYIQGIEPYSCNSINKQINKQQKKKKKKKEKNSVKTGFHLDAKEPISFKHALMIDVSKLHSWNRLE